MAVSNSFTEACIDYLKKAESTPHGVTTSNFRAIGLTKENAEGFHNEGVNLRTCDPVQGEYVKNSACESQTDLYSEYFLAEFLGNPKIASDCKSSGDESGTLRRIALGWTLSHGVQDKITCIAHKVPLPQLFLDPGVVEAASCSKR
jgi:hypothetical protein